MTNGKPNYEQRLIYAKALQLDEHRERAVAQHIADQEHDEKRRVREAAKRAVEREAKAKRDAEKAARGDKGKWVVVERAGGLSTRPIRYRQETEDGAILEVSMNSKGHWQGSINERRVRLDIPIPTDSNFVRDRVVREHKRQLARAA